MEGRTSTASKAEAKLWKKLMRVWKNHTPACAHEVAIHYTSSYPDNVCGWIVLRLDKPEPGLA